ncbi:MAG: YlcI/YnfO family protein [Microcystaceae cyanobacterium]
MPRSQLNFRIDPELLQAIQKAAKQEKKSVSQWILDTCQEKLGLSQLTTQESISILKK